MCTCVGACESLGPYSSIHLFFYGNIATATVRGQQSITIEPRDHTLDMELTEGRSIVVNFQTALSMDEFRIQMYSNPMVQQIALAEFQQTFQSHSSLRLRGGMSPRNEYVNNDSKFNEIPYLEWTSLH